jgi:non-heme chloroperoxidase
MTFTATLEAIQFRQATLRTGVQLNYVDIGPRTAPPLIFLHGYSDSWFAWSSVLRAMPPDFRLIVPDQRGHGESERPQNGYMLDSFALDAIALLDELGIGSACVVGHCLGGLVAQRMAALSPEHVNRLVLVSTAASANNEVIRSMRPEVESLTDPVSTYFIREFQRSTIHRPVSPAFFECVVMESSKLPSYVWKGVFDGLFQSSPLTNTSIQCPVSILWGARDTIFSRAEQSELLARIPSADFHTFPDVGHALHWEAPDELVSYLTTVLDAEEEKAK